MNFINIAFGDYSGKSSHTLENITPELQEQINYYTTLINSLEYKNKYLKYKNKYLIIKKLL